MDLFGGGGSVTRTRSEQGRKPGLRGQSTLFDLFNRTLIGNLMSPRATALPKPLTEAISGTEDILPSLFNQGFGQGRGLAGMLGPVGAAAGGGIGGAPPAPMFGRTQTREELGIQKPEVVDPRYLPSEEDVLKYGIPPVRRPGFNEQSQRLEDRLAELQGRRAGREHTKVLDQRIARTQAKIAKRKGSPRYLPGTRGEG